METEQIVRKYKIEWTIESETIELEIPKILIIKCKKMSIFPNCNQNFPKSF